MKKERKEKNQPIQFIFDGIIIPNIAANIHCPPPNT